MGSGRVDGAKVRFVEAHRLFNEMDDRVQMVGISSSLGGIFRELGDFKSAGRYLEFALLLSRELGDREAVAGTLFELASVHHLFWRVRGDGGLPRRGS